MIKIKQSKASKEKSKFRSTSKWKLFRNKMKKERKHDAVTLKPLYKGWQLHHCDMSLLNYKNLTNTDNFECLNRQTHEMIHWLFVYYRKDKNTLNRIKTILDKMEMLNHDTETM